MTEHTTPECDTINLATGCNTCQHVADTVGVEIKQDAAVEAVAAALRGHRVECFMLELEQFGGWHCLTCGAEQYGYSSIEVAEQYALGHNAASVIAFIREALHRDGDDADAIREALGLMFETRTAPDGWAGRYGREGFRIRRLTGGKWQEVPNDAR